MSATYAQFARALALVPPLLFGPSLGAQTKVAVPTAVLRSLGESLPESSGRGSSPLDQPILATLEATTECEVRLVFLWEGAGYRNTIGYFTYTTNGSGAIQIVDSDVLWRDASRPPQGNLDTGDQVVLRDRSGAPRKFQAGQRIGFFLLADGFNLERDLLDGWRFGQGGLPSAAPAENAALGRGCYTSIPQCNPEFDDAPEQSSHAVLVALDGVAGFLDGRDYFLCGFEDLDRRGRSDDDFNDCVFAIDGGAAGALRSVDVAFRIGDPDGDGVGGLRDLFPQDPERAFQRRFPAAGFVVLAFEDQYPDSLDTDYNDAVIACSTLEILDSRNRVKDILLEHHLVARGASYDHEWATHMPRLPADAGGTIAIERFFSGRTAAEPIERRTIQEVLANQRRIVNLFSSTRAALPSPDPRTPFANTEPAVYGTVSAASVRTQILFDRAVPRRDAPPYDPYLMVALDQGRADIHLPGRSGFSDRPASLPKEKGAKAFLDQNGNPWAMLLPAEWRFPLEGVPIRIAYPQFETWRDSRGKQSRQWFLHPTTQPDKVSAEIQSLIPARQWTLNPPKPR